MTAPVPPDALPPDAPATVEDVRASRRWTWVALAWAVAASAIAVIALIAANDNKSSDQPAAKTTDTTAEIRKFEKQANDRLDAFSRRLNGTAKTSDVQKLEKRLAKAEDDAAAAKEDVAKQTDAIDALKSEADDLKKRVEDLESQSQSPPQDQGTTTTP